MDHVRLHPMRPKPPRQPEAVAAGFEGKRNPRDLFTGSDCLIAPAMQQAKQPFGTRLQLLARLTLNAGKHTANQPTRLAHLDDGNDRAILVQGDEGPAQVVRLGHQGTPSVSYSDDGAISSPPAPYHLAAGGGRIRTLGPPSERMYANTEIAADREQWGRSSAEKIWHRCVISATDHPLREQPRPRACVCLTGKASCQDGHR